MFVYVTGDVVTLQVLGTTFLLLVWLYVMANVIVFGAAYNFEVTYARTGRAVQPEHAEHAVEIGVTNEAPDTAPVKGHNNPGFDQ